MSARLTRGGHTRGADRRSLRAEIADVALEGIANHRLADPRIITLRPTNSGKTLQDKSIELYRVHEELKGILLDRDVETICALVNLLNIETTPSAIEDARRQVIASLLGDFTDNKMAQKALRSAHIRRNFQFTFTLNIGDGKLHVIKLPENLCEILQKTDILGSYAYQTLDNFLAKLPAEERKKIDRGTAQYLDHGGKRYAYRVRFEGRNTVLLNAISESTGVGLRKLMEKEAELYRTASDLTLETIFVPEVFAVLGERLSSGIVMTDCTKGGNATLTCVQGQRRLIPDLIIEAYDRDMRALDNAIPHFRLYGDGSIYIQKSKKTGETKIVLLDMENCVRSF
ncbi:MAG: hypothetical protein ABID61_02040 [Candidatus Micrarchaeota archaeon]